MTPPPSSPPPEPAAGPPPPPLEAVPNVSEGRRAAVLERLAAAAAGPARLLDASRDPDHHRAVLTLAGDAAGLEEALLGLYGVVADEVDLRRHRGVHPRVGAVDVVPFVPLAATPMARAVAAARRLGRRVAERHGVPVLLYGEAATAPHRRDLAALRRGGLEALGARLAAAEWAPDFGPSRPHPRLGVSLVGARFFLVAANAWLDSADVALARDVARVVRESGGGLPAVRALGLTMERGLEMERDAGCAQVSMNLVDYRRTPPARAFAAVAREAAARGAKVTRRELIGLLPAAALAVAEPADGEEAEEAARLAELWGGRTLEAALGSGPVAPPAGAGAG